jgi:hypothetical protein
MSDEVLLSINEAAKLMLVCENTLRDWDIEGKFKAQRTDGGHRRYSLNQIRDFTSKKENKELLQKVKEWPIYGCSEPHSSVKVIVNKWEDLGFLNDIEDGFEKTSTAVLLENCLLSRQAILDPIFSTEQALWLTKESWIRCRFKKMVSIQPMIGPSCLSYFIENNMVLSSEAVGSKTVTANFKFFNKANFDSIKEVYADAIALEIDGIIFKLIEKNKLISEECFTNCEFDAKTLCDYLIAPRSFIEKIPKHCLNNIDVFEISCVLDPESLRVLFCAGKYPKSNFIAPTLHPYIIFQESSSSLNATSSCFLRVGTFDKNSFTKN